MINYKPDEDISLSDLAKVKKKAPPGFPNNAYGYFKFYYELVDIIV